VKDAFAKHFRGPEDGDDWDLLWTHRPQDVAIAELQSEYASTGKAFPERKGGTRLLNHCNWYEGAGDKCGFSRLTSRLIASSSQGDAGRHLRAYDLTIPHELNEWRAAVKNEPEKVWVMKPCLAGASQGIQLHKGKKALKAGENLKAETVAQEYLEQPYLAFGNRKFHIRLFVHVSRWAPTEAHLYDEGLVFRSLQEYDAVPNLDRDIFSSISQNVEALPLAALWQHLDSLPDDARSTVAAEEDATKPISQIVQQRIYDILKELLNAGEQDGKGPVLSRLSALGYSCFDLLGADIIFDTQLKPLVMEFNVGPNLWIDNHGEEHVEVLRSIKEPLMTQLAHWAAVTLQNADAKDRFNPLVNFTRLL
jgi:hypothetical protein